jgi:hypothetical protein
MSPGSLACLEADLLALTNPGVPKCLSQARGAVAECPAAAVPKRPVATRPAAEPNLVVPKACGQRQLAERHTPLASLWAWQHLAHVLALLL